MRMVLLLLAIISAIGIFTYSIYMFFKKKWKVGFQLLGVSLLVFFLSLFFVPDTVRLTIDKKEVETNQEGIARIEGKTNSSGTLTINGKSFSPEKNGEFVYQLKLGNEDSEVVEIIASYKEEKTHETVTVSASKAFKKRLALEKEKEEKIRLEKLEAEKKERALKEAETALALAEKDLTKDNLEHAKKRVAELKDVDQELKKRLAEITEKFEHIELVKEKTILAEKAIKIAEDSLTQQNYNEAKIALDRIPEENEVLAQRLVIVQKDLSELQAANIQSDTPQTNPPGTPNVERVLVTRTGSKYHRKKCGNGTYIDATLTEALNRGLQPCQKCF